MNVIMSDEGQIVVPKEARERRHLGKGAELQFIDDASGDLIFRPLRSTPSLDLVDHLRELRGLEIVEREHHCPPRL